MRFARFEEWVSCSAFGRIESGATKGLSGRHPPQAPAPLPIRTRTRSKRSQLANRSLVASAIASKQRAKRAN